MPGESRISHSRSGSGVFQVEALPPSPTQEGQAESADAQGARSDDGPGSTGEDFSRLSRALSSLRNELAARAVYRGADDATALIVHLENEIARAREFALPVPPEIVLELVNSIKGSLNPVLRQLSQGERRDFEPQLSEVWNSALRAAIGQTPSTTPGDGDMMTLAVAALAEVRLVPLFLDLATVTEIGFESRGNDVGEFFFEDDFRRRRIVFKTAVQEAIARRIEKIEAEVLRARRGAPPLSSAILTGELATIHGLAMILVQRRNSFLGRWAVGALSSMGLRIDVCDQEQQYLRAIESKLQRPLDMALRIRSVAVAYDGAGSEPFDHVAWWLRDLDVQLRAYVADDWPQLLKDVSVARRAVDSAASNPAAADLARLERLVRLVLFGVRRLCEESEPKREADLQKLSGLAASNRERVLPVAGARPQGTFVAPRGLGQLELGRHGAETEAMLDLWSLSQVRVAAQGLRNQAECAFRRPEPVVDAGDDEKAQER